MIKQTTTLDKVQPGQTAIVVKLVGNGHIQRRLVDMGVVSNTEIFVCRFAPLGDPMEIKLKGFNLALRKQEAANIVVTLVDD